MKCLQVVDQWEGWIDTIHHKWTSADGDVSEIDCRLTLVRTEEEFFATIPVDKIPEHQRDRIALGAYIFVNATQDKDKQIEVSVCIPQILWTQEELDAAKVEAQRIRDELGWG